MNKENNNPFFSIIYPTRDRPFLLKYCLDALLLQNFTNFEVIICDNYRSRSAHQVFEKFKKDKRFRYIKPNNELTMHDNWEYAVKFAKGQYVSVLTDKMVLTPDALEKVYTVLIEQPVDVITWREEFFTPDDKGDKSPDYGSGFLRLKYTRALKPFKYDGHAYLKEKYAFKVRRGTEGASYYWGKICFGCYRKTLIETIKKRTGRVFWKYSPDYTAMVSALILGKTFIDIGEALHVVFSVKISNGQQNSTNINYLMDTYKRLDPSLSIIKKLPFPDLYISLHNFVALDYKIMKNKLADEMSDITINRLNLYIRIMEDFGGYKWQNRKLLKEYLSACYKEWLLFSVTDKFYSIALLFKYYALTVYRRIKHKLDMFILYGPFSKYIKKNKPVAYDDIIEACKSISNNRSNVILNKDRV